MRLTQPFLPHRYRCAILAALALFADGGVLAEEPPPPADRPNAAVVTPAGASAPADAFRLLKRFDFDERKNGNFEKTPMRWQRLSGDGLPAYSRGMFDEALGHAAPPSFCLNIELGNVAYEYGHTDLDVLPGAAYRVVGYVRSVGIVHARAFLAAFFVNRYGERVAESLRISELASSASTSEAEWQRITVDLAGEFPQAASLRLQLWILQSDVWRAVDAPIPDAIPRQDVQARAWFDDISIYVVPQTHLRFSDPAHLVRPGEAAALIVDVDNATGQELPVDLRITDESGRDVFRHRLAVPGGTRRPVEFPVPPLAPGAYSATLQPQVAFDVPLERRLRFAVLPALPPPPKYGRDMGIDLSAWQAVNTTAIAELAANLNAAAAKLRVPLLGVIDTETKRTQLGDLSATLQALALARVDVVGVLAPPRAGDAASSLQAYCAANPDWPAVANPILAQLGGRISTWQLGRETDELTIGSGWSSAQIEDVRAHILRFNSLPEIVVPTSPLVPLPDGRDVRSVLVQSSIPAPRVPSYLDFLAQPDTAPRWVQIDALDNRGVPWTQRIADLARRVVLAKALSPDRVFVAAPFEPVESENGCSWQPTAAYVPLRTVMHYLSGKRAASVTRLEPDGLLILFRDDSEAAAHCAVAWSWQDCPADAPLALYLGANATVVDLWGARQPLEQRDGRAMLTLTPTPVVIEDLDLSAALIATTFRVEPTHVLLHARDPRPVLTFRNGAVGRITGQVEVTPPGDWQVEPQRFRFDLAPGEAVETPLTMTLPRRLLHDAAELDVRVDVESPSTAKLRFTVPLTIGLGDVEMEAVAEWAGDRLVVRQSLRNHSSGPVSFDGFCQPPQRSRAQHAFLEVASGDTAEHLYVFDEARPLAGTRVHVGIREIRGQRIVERLVDVPP